MTIHFGSRYENATVDFVSFYDGGDAAPVVFYSFSDIGKLSYTEYTWKEGDRLDRVAMEFFKDSAKWWVIPEFNPEILDPQNIPAGTVLRIPNV